MKRLFALSLIFVAISANADCHMRSDIKLTNKLVKDSATDYQKMLVPDRKRGLKCILRYRVNLDGNWNTAEGVGYGKTEEQACISAMDLTNGAVLLSVAPAKVSANTDMVCNDLPDIQVHPVKIGDVIWESETDVHSHPQERGYFDYKRTRCRMFVERNAQFQNLYTYQGIICRLNTTQYSKWQVIDKY
jgi:hypothetical protein